MRTYRNGRGPWIPTEMAFRIFLFGHNLISFGPSRAHISIHNSLHALLLCCIGEVGEAVLFSYNHSDQNLTAVRIPQGRWTSPCVKFENAIVNWRFNFAAA